MHEQPLIGDESTLYILLSQLKLYVSQETT